MTRAEKVAKARELRAQGLTLREIGARMGCSFKTVSGWLNDPDGSRLRARKDSYRGECQTCGAATDGSNGADAAPEECGSCRWRRQHDERRWTPESIPAAMRRWAERHGRQPTANDWRSAGLDHPNTSVVVHEMGWDAAVLAAGFRSQSRFRGLDRDEVVRLYADEGRSAWWIARHLNVSGSTISWHLEHAGVERRSLAEAMALYRSREQAAA